MATIFSAEGPTFLKAHPFLVTTIRKKIRGDLVRSFIVRKGSVLLVGESGVGDKDENLFRWSESPDLLESFSKRKTKGGELTQPMAKRLKLFGIPYLVGKISRSIFFFRVQDG